MQFDRQKLKEAVQYIVSNCEPDNLGAVKLNKVMYYCDMLSYALNGAAITGASYRKRPFGPACDDILFALRDLSREGSIEIKDQDYFGYVKKQYVPRRDYARERLTDRDSLILDEMIKFVCQENTAKTISELSHGAPWEMVDYGDEIPYLSAFNLIPNLLDVETIEWAESEGHKIADQKFSEDSVGVSGYRDFRSRVLQTLGR